MLLSILSRLSIEQEQDWEGCWKQAPSKQEQEEEQNWNSTFQWSFKYFMAQKCTKKKEKKHE